MLIYKDLSPKIHRVAKVGLGDLQARTLVIEEGVIFNGQCNVNPDGTKFEKQNMEKLKM